MKSNELMIGDWVSLYDYDGAIAPLRVVELHFEELLLQAREDTACDIWGYEDIVPIPLTAEILGKNPYVLPLMDFHFSTEELSINGYILNATNKIEGILYVHTLQHALRLCGLNELADNFKV